MMILLNCKLDKGDLMSLRPKTSKTTSELFKQHIIVFSVQYIVWPDQPLLVWYSTHCNTTQLYRWCTEYSTSVVCVVNRYPAIYVISCVGEENGRIKIVSSFSAIKLCFVIYKLNNKTITLFNLVAYRLILANSPYGLVGLVG